MKFKLIEKMLSYPQDYANIELEYRSLDIGDNHISWTYEVDKKDLYDFIFENCITEEDFPAAFADEFDPDNEEDWNSFVNWLEDNFDEVFSKYENDILEHYEDSAREDAQENYDPRDYIDWDSMPGGHDDYRFDKAINEGQFSQRLTKSLKNKINSIIDYYSEVVNELTTKLKAIEGFKSCSTLNFDGVRWSLDLNKTTTTINYDFSRSVDKKQVIRTVQNIINGTDIEIESFEEVFYPNYFKPRLIGDWAMKLRLELPLVDLDLQESVEKVDESYYQLSRDDFTVHYLGQDENLWDELMDKDDDDELDNYLVSWFKEPGYYHVTGGGDSYIDNEWVDSLQEFNELCFGDESFDESINEGEDMKFKLIEAANDDQDLIKYKEAIYKANEIVPGLVRQLLYNNSLRKGVQTKDIENLSIHSLRRVYEGIRKYLNRRIHDRKNPLELSNDLLNMFDLDPASDYNFLESKDSKICCICKKPFNGYGNNAEPVCSGSCCDECNMKEVIPARMKRMKDIDESLNESNEDNPWDWLVKHYPAEFANMKETPKEKIEYYLNKINNAEIFYDLQDIEKEMDEDAEIQGTNDVSKLYARIRDRNQELVQEAKKRDELQRQDKIKDMKNKISNTHSAKALKDLLYTVEHDADFYFTDLPKELKAKYEQAEEEEYQLRMQASKAENSKRAAEGNNIWDMLKGLLDNE